MKWVQIAALSLALVALTIAAREMPEIIRYFKMKSM